MESRVLNMPERSYYKNTISNFLAASDSEILGELTNHHHFDIDLAQKNAWIGQIANLKKEL